MGLSERTGTYGTYWGNDFNSSNSLTMEQMQVNATYIWTSLSASGWSLNAVAGMLGNMQSESSINPRKMGRRYRRWRPYCSRLWISAMDSIY